MIKRVSGGVEVRLDGDTMLKEGVNLASGNPIVAHLGAELNQECANVNFEIGARQIAAESMEHVMYTGRKVNLVFRIEMIERMKKMGG